MAKTGAIIDYPQEYREACFYAWYKNGRPGLGSTDGGGHVVKILPAAPDGRKPNIATIRNWMNSYGWVERADGLEGEVSRILDKGAIRDRAKQIQKLAEAGEIQMNKGLDYFKNEENPFKDNPSAAVRAITSGAEMVYKYAGHVSALLAVYEMSDKQLDREMLRLLGKNENEENTENTIDVVPEDIPSEDDDNADDNE